MKNFNKKKIFIAIAALSVGGLVFSLCKGKTSTSCKSCGN